MTPQSPDGNIMETITARLNEIRSRISTAEQRYGRKPGSVTLVAASKAQPAAAILTAYRAHQRHFGESYLQEALAKQIALTAYDITWHFIGALQSNKTRSIAQHFAWVHSVDRLKTAERLNAQRPPELPPLDICIQVNIGAEQQKSGAEPNQLSLLAEQVSKLSRLRLRGLMALPPASADFDEQRHYFEHLRNSFEQLQAQGYSLDTLSMGMSADLEAAIAEGATMVRVGTALFGKRMSETQG